MNTHFALNIMWKACVEDMCIIVQYACKACMSLKVVQSQTGQLVTLAVIVELRAQLSIWCVAPQGQQSHLVSLSDES